MKARAKTLRNTLREEVSKWYDMCPSNEEMAALCLKRILPHGGFNDTEDQRIMDHYFETFDLLREYGEYINPGVIRLSEMVRGAWYELD